MDKKPLILLYVPVNDKTRRDFGGKHAEVGTGYPVGKDLILTALHVLQPKWRDKRYTIKIYWHSFPNLGLIDIPEENIVWRGENGLDAALIRCPAAGWPAGVVGGQLSAERPSDNTEWASAGFPRASRCDTTRKPASFIGKVCSQIPQQPYFELTVEIAPVQNQECTAEQNWQGASGMPVFVGAKILGVVQSVPANFGAGLLHATPSWQLLEDPIFCDKIGYVDPEIAIAEHWLAWEENLRDKQFLPRIDYHFTTVLASPLSAIWNGFINQSTWHDQLRELINKLLKEGEYHGLSQLVDPYRAIHYDSNYRQLLEEVEILNQELDAALMKTIRELRNKEKRAKQPRQAWEYQNSEKEFTRANEKLLKVALQVQSIAQEVKDLVKAPYFNRCFCVMGALGSGRTHFVTTLLGQRPGGAATRDYFLLPLSVALSNGDLETWLIDLLCKATGTIWNSLEECLDSLFKRGKRVVVVLDDLQFLHHSLAGFEEMLRTFVEATTHLHGLYWLFTLHDTEYDTISRQKDFWNRYGYRSNDLDILRYDHGDHREKVAAAQHSGWIMLNELNRADHFGYKLLNELERSQLAADLVENEATVVRYLDLPFMAWLVHMLSDAIDVTSLISLNFIGFVDLFWKDRLKRVETRPLSTRDVQSCILRIAELLVKQGNFTPTTEEILAILSTTDLRWAGDALSVLEKMSLLTRIHDHSDASGWDNTERVQLQFEVFWHRRLAAQMYKRWEERQGDVIGFWADVGNVFDSITAVHVREGIWEFFLLHIDDNAKEDAEWREAVWRAWKMTLEGHEFIPAQAVFFAGTWASDWVQERLVNQVRDIELTGCSSRVLFGLMHFVSETEVISFPEAMEILHPHYERIRDCGLADYYFFLCRRLVGQEVELVKLVSAMHQFAGCQIIGEYVARELATVCWERLLDLTNSDINDVVSAIVKYLVDDQPSAEDEYATIHVDKKPRRGYFFREWILKLYCHRLVTEKGAMAYDVFAETMGYGTDQSNYSQFSMHLVAEIEREINLAFGHWYHDNKHGLESHSEHNVRFYRRLVKRLFYGKPGEPTTPGLKRIAWFLIRHTGHIDGRSAKFVDNYFAGIVRDIRLDPIMRQVVVKYPIQTEGEPSGKNTNREGNNK